MEKVIGKQILFSFNNGWAKYYQIDEIENDDIS
jgi:hypothetical protein